MTMHAGVVRFVVVKTHTYKYTRVHLYINFPARLHYRYATAAVVAVFVVAVVCTAN